jgi:hypothetical protein
MTHFDETSRWIGWSKNEFSHSLALQATAGVPARSMMKFISIPFFALRHRRHRLCLSLIR